MPSELDPNAPIFTPPFKNNFKSSSENSTPATSPRVVKEPQCSRYSRRTVKHQILANSPRPILGTKPPFPRPILGKKDEPFKDEADEYIGKEFRNLNRTFQRMKLKEENKQAKQKEESLS